MFVNRRPVCVLKDSFILDVRATHMLYYIDDVIDGPKIPSGPNLLVLNTRFNFRTQKASKTSNMMGLRPVKSINQSITRCNYYIEDVYMLLLFFATARF